VSDAPVIEVRDLAKTYRTPFRRKKVEALRGVSFAVQRGEIFGFLGPNGAGKTTTIRILMGLIEATGGAASIFGDRVPSRAARQRLGFLPEQPYFYDYLTVGELCDLAGRLFGVDGATRRERADRLIARVGLERARTQPLKKFSKGMMQRIGLAQALLHDPDVLILDEPMSGLDPIGRKEVRDLILELREAGKTVFFSSHILTDVEAISDRVAIVARGKILAFGTPHELLRQSVLGIDVTLRLPDGVDPAALAEHVSVRRTGQDVTLTLPGDADVDALLARGRELGAKVVAVAPRHETLEDLFLRRIADQDRQERAA
jgi:ABC-2 type transport system ATP-binding protein